MDKVILVPTNPGLANAMDDDETKPLMICRVCLSTTRRVYSLHALRLAATYSALSGVTLHERGRGLPQAACAACAARLRSARQLSERSQRANELLIGLLEKTFKITPEAVNELDRDDPILTVSTLVPVLLGPDHFDLYIKEEVKDQEEVLAKDQEEVKDQYNTDQVKLDQDNLVVENVEEIVEAAEVVAEELEYLNSEDPMESDETTEEKEAKDLAKEPAEDQVQTGELVSRYFKVQKLSLPEQILELEKAKLSANYLESTFKCDMCYKGFVSEATFSSHMTRHNKSNGSFECPVCHVWLKSSRALSRHSDGHNSLYTCKECALTTRHKATATTHARWHRGTVYKCDLCTEDVTFTRITSLLSHLRLRHPGSRHCPLCGYSFLGEKGLTQHLTYKHAGETIPTEGPRCEDCGTVFANEDARAKHQKVTHERSERNEQSLARIRRAQRRTPSDPSDPYRPRRRRVDSAKNIKPRKPVEVEGEAVKKFFCPVCGEGYAERLQLRRHTRDAHGCSAPMRAEKRAKQAKLRYMALHYQCHVCGRLYKCAATLKDHMGVHSATPSHTCPDCGKGYKTRVQMMLHLRSHTDRYACPLCPKVFNAACNRDRHYTYVHTTVRDIKCDFCDKTFKCQASRRLHERYVHIEMSWPKRKRTRKPAQVES